MGRDDSVREGGGGEYNGECLLNDDRDDDEYNNDNKTMTQRMGRGCAREWTTGARLCILFCVPFFLPSSSRNPGELLPSSCKKKEFLSMFLFFQG